MRTTMKKLGFFPFCWRIAALFCVWLALMYPNFSVFCNANNFTDVNDPELLKIRDHIITAYYKRPNPVNQCGIKWHQAAVKLYTSVLSSQEQEDMLLDMQASIIGGEDDYFVGIPETLAALASSKIKYLLYWEGLYINSATYRNPLSGRTVSLHSLFTPSVTISLNYTEPETESFMELINCFPFPKWVKKYYKNYVPRITRLQTATTEASGRNLYLRVSDGIGGRFTEIVKFANNSWLLDIYRTSSIRKSVLLKGFANNTVDAMAWDESTNLESSSEYDSAAGENVSHDLMKQNLSL